MSHSITLAINNQDSYHILCDNLLEKINEIKAKINNENIEYTKLINSINEIKRNLSKKFTSEEYIEFLKHISSTEKYVANLYLNIKNDLINSLISNFKKNEINIIEEFKQHGCLANEVLEYLQENNLEINKLNFDKFLPIVQDIELTKEKITNYLKQSFEFIDQSKLPNNIKYELKKEIRNIHSINNIKDINAIIQTKENDYLRIIEISKITSKMLSKQNFKFTGIKKWEYNPNNGEIIFKFNLKNESNNTVQMVINSNGQLKYKLGNYIGHACEKTTNKLIEDLRKANIKVNIINITRDFEYNENSKQKELVKEK